MRNTPNSMNGNKIDCREHQFATRLLLLSMIYLITYLKDGIWWEFEHMACRYAAPTATLTARNITREHSKWLFVSVQWILLKYSFLAPPSFRYAGKESARSRLPLCIQKNARALACAEREFWYAMENAVCNCWTIPVSSFSNVFLFIFLLFYLSLFCSSLNVVRLLVWSAVRRLRVDSCVADQTTMPFRINVRLSHSSCYFSSFYCCCFSSWFWQQKCRALRIQSIWVNHWARFNVHQIHQIRDQCISFKQFS